jgi:hypothetical protein
VGLGPGRQDRTVGTSAVKVPAVVAAILIMAETLVKAGG